MQEEPKPATGRSYSIGDVSAGARVAQGENISWVEGVASLPGGGSLAQQFTALLERIAQEGSLDEDTRELAQDKTKAVAEGVAKVEESPGAPQRVGGLLQAAWLRPKQTDLVPGKGQFRSRFPHPLRYCCPTTIFLLGWTDPTASNVPGCDCVTTQPGEPSE